jgi:hypothetical protein
VAHREVREQAHSIGAATTGGQMIAIERTKSRAVAFGCSAKISGPQDKVARKEDTHLFSHHSKAATHTLAPGEGLISFFSPAELKESQDEWRLPMPHPDGPRASRDEGEQLVGREIMVDQLGVGKVTDFHDFHDFNIRENHDPPWTSAHTVRFFENGLDTHGVERTVKLMTADELQWMKDVKYEKLQDPKIRARVSASHRAYMVRVVEAADENDDLETERLKSLNKDTKATTQDLDSATAQQDKREHIDMVFKMVDRDGSGTLSFSEFAAWLTRRQMATQGFVTPGFLKELQLSWSKFDVDGSHTLSHDEFEKVMEDIADSDWREAKDPESGRNYFFNKHTGEACWTKPSHDTEINDFLIRNGVNQAEAQDHHGQTLTINIQKALKKLRVRPNYYAGRRHFCWFLLYLSLLVLWWSKIADIDDGRGVETGLHSRISSIQFEVTPGPHFSQSIRATNWAGVRNLGDVYDLTQAIVENLYSDDDSTYFTPEDRVELKANTLRHVYRNSEFAPLWEAVGIDTDSQHRRQNCSNWVVTAPSDGGFDGECDFFERCTGEILEEMRRIVALGGAGNVATFAARESECRRQRCGHRYDMVYHACGGTLTRSAGAAGDDIVLMNCENPGCKAKLRLADLWDLECAVWMGVEHPTLTAEEVTTCLTQTSPTNHECGAIDTPAVSGLELKRACEARAGCKYWTELWRESCVSAPTYNTWKADGSKSNQRYNSGDNIGLTNLYNHPLPWLRLRMNRRKLTGCDIPAQCMQPDCPAGYVRGTAEVPSTTCPENCDLSWAVAAVPASCTGGTGSNGAACDLDAATDGTAVCPPGCTYNPAVAGSPETCEQSSALPESCVAAMCADGSGIFTEEVDKEDFIGAETGSVYQYQHDEQDDEGAGGFPFYIRLDDENPQTWIGLLELLRADRWLSYNTQDFTMECMTLNRNTNTLGYWSITWTIDRTGMVKKPEGLVVRSFPLEMADPTRRSAGSQFLGLVVFLCLFIDFTIEARKLTYFATIEFGDRERQLQMTVSHTRRQHALFALFSSAVCLWAIVWMFSFFFGMQALDPARIEPELVNYQFTGMTSESASASADEESGCKPAGSFDPSCEMKEKIKLMEQLSDALASWVTYRNLWSVFCVYNSMRLLTMCSFARNMTVLLTTIQTRAVELFYFVSLVVISGYGFTIIAYHCFGRRFFAFRSFESTMFALMAPILGGDSSLEAAVIESSRAGDNNMSVVVYWIYACYLIFLVYNVFIAIIVDGYEEAKDLEENRRNTEDLLSDVLRLNELLDVMVTQVVVVPPCDKNVLYIKVHDVKVYSCGNEPLQPVSEHLEGFEFEVSVVQPWHGIPKVDPTGTRTTKASFTYVIKIERSQAPPERNGADGWPCEFQLQALVRTWKRSGTKGERWSELVNSVGIYLAWGMKLWRSVKTGYHEVTAEEKWARDGLNYMEVTLTDYINDQIDIHARNLIVDGTLDHDEAAELEHHAKTREFVETHKFITARVLELKRKHEAARTSTLYRSDPTLQKRLEQLEEEIRRLRVIEKLSATELSHRDMVDALSKGRNRMLVDGQKRHRPSPRCPKPLMKKLWKAFATSEDEDLAETVGPPATWKQMERLDDKVTAMMNCDVSPDQDSTLLPALASRINDILDSVKKIEAQVQLVTTRVDNLTFNFTSAGGMTAGAVGTGGSAPIIDPRASSDASSRAVGRSSTGATPMLTVEGLLVPPPPPARDLPEVRDRSVSSILAASPVDATATIDAGEALMGKGRQVEQQGPAAVGSRVSTVHENGGGAARLSPRPSGADAAPQPGGQNARRSSSTTNSRLAVQVESDENEVSGLVRRGGGGPPPTPVAVVGGGGGSGAGGGAGPRSPAAPHSGRPSLLAAQAATSARVSRPGEGDGARTGVDERSFTTTTASRRLKPPTQAGSTSNSPSSRSGSRSRGRGDDDVGSGRSTTSV